ncbi:MAG TPA: LUD domain-containing protein, partial [Segetibacter sp.]
PDVLLAPFTPVEQEVDVLPAFVTALTGVGGFCNVVNDFNELTAFLETQKQKGLSVVNGCAALAEYNISTYKNYPAAQLQDVDTVVLQGTVAVAENGAVWIPGSNIVNRALPFICQHLILIITTRDIVTDMHQAYNKIKISDEGYGVFIAGPSKTADIEQSLVVGAHGALSLQVYILP